MEAGTDVLIGGNAIQSFPRYGRNDSIEESVDYSAVTIIFGFEALLYTQLTIPLVYRFLSITQLGLVVVHFGVMAVLLLLFCGC